jgi:hypothetical protein
MRKLTARAALVATALLLSRATAGAEGLTPKWKRDTKG